MNKEEIIQKLQLWFDTQKRSTWLPKLENGDKNINGSKFGGTPWLAENETYPCCGECGEKMPLFVQIDLNQIPSELSGKFGEGLLQMFYCTDCDNWEAFDHTKLIRIIQPTENYHDLQNQEFPSFPAKTIIGWTQADDYPDGADCEELGLIYDYNFTYKTVKIDCPSVGLSTEYLPINDVPEIEEICDKFGGDKLAGYPDWVQGSEYPNCPICNTRMQLFLQIDSEDNLPYMFGDVGCGHITQCPEHKHILTFVWACC